MSTTTKDVGDKTRLTVTFTNLAGTAANPTAVSFAMVDPTGTTTSYVYGVDAELVLSATGVYYVDWTTAKAGRHRYRFVGTGTVAQAVGGDLFALRNDTA